MSTRFLDAVRVYLFLLAAMATSSVGGASYEAVGFFRQLVNR